MVTGIVETSGDINTAVTGIHRDSQRAECYDLNGRKTSDAQKQKGIYIKGGKTVLMK